MMMSCAPNAMAATTAASLFCGGGDLDGGAAFGQQQLQSLFPAKQPQQQMTAPGAWFFQQQPLEVAADGTANGTLDGYPMPPCAATPPAAMAQQQLLARFGPRHTTESVEVPSSEHVAEIVGRQGCKIKALRAKTNTYIKTPVRGEEPVFVVTGRHEDVAEAKREIECAAEHFTQIRASRRHSQGGCPAPGHVTAYVRVPLRVVGLVVGPKGNTIKRIQQDTHTYIITPSREREPIFEVTGLPANVEAARREIEQHIYQRTGNMPITDQNASIANYDLQVRDELTFLFPTVMAAKMGCTGGSHSSAGGAAALQAQQAAMQANSLNRPNYGALAITSSRNLLSQQNNNGHSQSPYQPYMAHFQQQQLFGSGAFSSSMSLGAADFAAPDAKLFRQPQAHFPTAAAKLYERTASGSPPLAFSQQQNNINSATLGTSASANNLHLLMSALDMDAAVDGQGLVGQQGRERMQPFPVLSSVNGTVAPRNKQLTASSLLLRSAPHLQPGAGSAFSPWNPTAAAALDAANGGPDFMELLSSTSPSPLFSSSNGCPSSSYSGSALGSAGGGGGLSSVHSTSRDEGLGDSPTNSFGRPNGADPYQHLMTIWADVCEAGVDKKADAEQFETEKQRTE